MSTETVLAVAGIVVNALLVVFGGVISLYLRSMSAQAEGTGQKLEEAARELHTLQVEFGKFTVQVASIEAMRGHMDDLREHIHAMQVTMAANGWQVTQPIPRHHRGPDHDAPRYTPPGE
jgi:hypothetical protein